MDDVGTGTSALITTNNEKRIIKSEINPVVEKYLSREFTGLVPTVADDLETSIYPGLFGSSTGYTPYSHQNDHSNADI